MCIGASVDVVSGYTGRVFTDKSQSRAFRLRRIFLLQSHALGPLSPAAAAIIPSRIMRSGGAVNSRSQIPLDRRPDLIDLAGPDYDVAVTERANKTLIICSAPRTGSYELCRFLLAAGLGIPFEYMHPQFASQIAPREVLGHIAGALGVPVNESALAKMIAGKQALSARRGRLCARDRRIGGAAPAHRLRTLNRDYSAAFLAATT
jgi:hypothetical protein